MFNIKKIFFKNTLFLFVFFFFYIVNIKNINIFYIISIDNSININLVNGLIIIHPICIYITYIFCIKFIYNVNIKKNNLKFYNLNYNFKFILIFSISALLLGSY